MSLRESMSDRVKQILVRRILKGIYKPGDRLVELQLARELDTSQAPVREALRELEVMRLVECQTYRGTRVREVSQRELQESYQVRSELEALAARLAAPKFSAHPESIQEALAALKVAAAKEDIEQFTQCNTAFHRLIVETSGNSILLRVWDSLTFEALTLINLVLVKQKMVNLQSFNQQHQAIVDALVQGDGETAAQLLRSHLETAGVANSTP
ncbi:GntR family transcriptional regulator [Iningainema tapete]|uniref:GntR family transcriptional regulator n=1 Tax=Iningainema tapete BLCC-T55 TaxID=2748662 RepID=A0A8J7C897_9CYAN|nr:GntR family transcriptional regulator [Iningainema tapete]MBD2774331.1 GntR family transcriptional regulator [Iningainema tapete BLCC-T55]